MSEHTTPDPLEHPAAPEQPKDGFAEGEASPEVYPEDEAVRRYSEGQEELPDVDPEKQEHGRFSEGQEELPETEDKVIERRFSEGQEESPDSV